MSVLLFLLFGLVIGFIARALMPGRQDMGWFATGCVGVLGSLLGGLVTSLFTRSDDITGLHPAGVIGSIIGALVVLAIYTGVTRRRIHGDHHYRTT